MRFPYLPFHALSIIFAETTVTTQQLAEGIADDVAHPCAHRKLTPPCLVMYHDLMNITLPPQSEQYLREQLAAGRFPSAEAMVAEALRRMAEYDQKMDELRRDIALGIKQADQGITTEFNEATLERVKTKARQTSP